MNLNSKIPLKQRSDDELRAILGQFGRNGLIGDEAMKQKQAIEAILAERTAAGVEVDGQLLHHPT